MAIEIKITGESAKDALTQLAELASGMSAGTNSTFAMNSVADTETVPAKVPKQVKTAKVIEAPAPAVEATPEPQPEAPSGEDVKLDDIMVAVTKKSQAGHKEAVKQLLGKYKAERVSALDKTHYAAFLNDLNTIGA
ncbi:MAG: hypothetical protein EBX40_00435 [Gammaproteobacteria bacterium]|nr:hypothetical protein [Gammaproteobacteria bacterium]